MSAEQGIQSGLELRSIRNVYEFTQLSTALGQLEVVRFAIAQEYEEDLANRNELSGPEYIGRGLELTRWPKGTPQTGDHDPAIMIGPPGEHRKRHEPLFRTMVTSNGVSLIEDNFWTHYDFDNSVSAQDMLDATAVFFRKQPEINQIETVAHHARVAHKFAQRKLLPKLQGIDFHKRAL